MLAAYSSTYLERSKFSLTYCTVNIGLGDMAQKIITIIFSYQSISIIITINVKSLFLSSLKTDFCSKVKVLETRPLIFLNTILI